MAKKGGEGPDTDENSEEIKAPDAKFSLDNIDAALADAEKAKLNELKGEREEQKRREAERQRMLDEERYRGSCSC